MFIGSSVFDKICIILKTFSLLLEIANNERYLFVNYLRNEQNNFFQIII